MLAHTRWCQVSACARLSLGASLAQPSTLGRRTRSGPSARMTAVSRPPAWPGSKAHAPAAQSLLFDLDVRLLAEADPEQLLLPHSYLLQAVLAASKQHRSARG